MDKEKTKQAFTILILGSIGWALCGSLIGIGQSITSMKNTLIIHAIGAPIIFAAISYYYHTKYNYTTPIQTATIFLSIIIFLDIFIVALLIEKSFEMFTSIIGTWIPWVLIYTSTYLTGIKVQ